MKKSDRLKKLKLDIESLDFDDAEKFVFDVGIRGLTPDKSLSVSEWADTYRYLDSVNAAESGKYRTSRTPYLRSIMDALSVHSPYTEIIFKKGAQIGASEAAVNFMGYVADNSPGSLLYVMPSIDSAKEFSKLRVDPLVENTPVIKGKVKEARSRDSGNTTLLKEFPGGFWALTGANSGVGLRSKPIRFLVTDEISAYPSSIDGEGDPYRLAVARTRTYGSRKKIFVPSTPTVEGDCRISNLYEQTDQRRYFLPCPHCGHMQYLKWERIRWTDDDPSTAHYVCESCEARIENHEKTEMMERGEWRSTMPENISMHRIGFHLSALYSPVGWYSWAEAVSDFLEAKRSNDVAKLQSFINTVLGEAWVDRTDAPDWQQIYMRREQYQIGVVPAPCLILTGAADIQKDRIEVEVKGWTRSLESYSVEHIVLIGDTLQEDVWRKLDELLYRTWPHELGVSLGVRGWGIDSGYISHAVYLWSRKHPSDKVYVLDGMPSDIPIGLPKLTDINYKGKRISNGARRWPIGTNALKREIYSRLKMGLTEDAEYPPYYMHYPEYPPEFFKQLAAESFGAKSKHGKKQWSKHYERNEALDLAVYNRAVALILGIDRLSDDDWQRVEKMFEQTPQLLSGDQQHGTNYARPVARRVMRSRGIQRRVQ